ncbi:MAG: retropepsin-like aspartic protease [Candidatus Binatia bacterium]
MSHRFDSKEGLIVVPARLLGPAGDTVVRLALDTGATDTLVNTEVLVLLGYDPVTAPERIQIMTGSGIAFCARLSIERIETVGRMLEQFPLLCHTLPSSTRIDGLLGLDFLRGCYLGIDLRSGEISVT